MNCLEIGVNNLGYPADFGGSPQLVHTPLMFALEVSQGLQRHLDANLVSVLEAIGYRLGGIRDLHGNPFDLMLLHTKLQDGGDMKMTSMGG